MAAYVALEDKLHSLSASSICAQMATGSAHAPSARSSARLELGESRNTLQTLLSLSEPKVIPHFDAMA